MGSMGFLSIEDDMKFRKGSVGSVGVGALDEDFDFKYRVELEDLKASVSGGRVAMQARRDSEAKLDSLIPPEGHYFGSSMSPKRRLSGDVSSLLMSLSTADSNETRKCAKFRKQKSDRAIKTNLFPSLSKDPRCWSRDNVSTWLDFTVRRNGLPFVSIESFKMNGKGLSLMTMDMFSARAPNGGKTLFKDFQLRLTDAIHDLDQAGLETAGEDPDLIME